MIVVEPRGRVLRVTVHNKDSFLGWSEGSITLSSSNVERSQDVVIFCCGLEGLPGISVAIHLGGPSGVLVLLFLSLGEGVLCESNQSCSKVFHN